MVKTIIGSLIQITKMFEIIQELGDLYTREKWL